MTRLQKLHLITLLLLWYRDEEFSDHETDVLFQAVYRLLREMREQLKYIEGTSSLDDIPF